MIKSKQKTTVSSRDRSSEKVILSRQKKKETKGKSYFNYSENAGKMCPVY
jgi:hypothetical protein